jgi:hypothetical protein
VAFGVVRGPAIHHAELYSDTHGGKIVTKAQTPRKRKERALLSMDLLEKTYRKGWNEAIEYAAAVLHNSGKPRTAAEVRNHAKR